MKIHLRCFASVRELLGAAELELELAEGSTVRDLRATLTERAADLGRLPFTVAVNRQYADDTRLLAEGDEVALIPPISGGSGEQEPPRFRFTLVDGPLDPRPLEEEVRTDHDGAVLSFAGVTRDHNEGAEVRCLRYEAFAEMAEQEMERLFVQAAERFDFGRARVAHRLGEVPIGEASVLVVVGSAHRGPAFEACRFLMDELKKRVPIFKKELLSGPDGGERWIGDLPQV